MKLDKQKTQILKYTIYFLVPVLVLVGLLIVILGITYDDNKLIKSESMPELKVLTPEEVEAERHTFSRNMVGAKAVADPAEINETVPDKKEEVEAGQPEPAKTQVVRPEPSENLVLDRELSEEISSSIDSNYVSSVEVNSTSNSGKKIVVKASSHDKTAKTVRGTIYSMDFPNNKIIVAQSNDLGLATVILSPNTKVLVNNKLMNVTDLKGSDRIVVQGIGYPDNSNIEATEISLVGYIKINP